MSDLERAQEWLGCQVVHDNMTGDVWCLEHSEIDAWPCSEATRLAALLAETRADECGVLADLYDTDDDAAGHARYLWARAEKHRSTP